MTILLYDHIELEERASKHLKVWKVWHLVLYVFAAILGVLNFVSLLNTMQLVDNNCVLFPRQLEFHWVDLPVTPLMHYAQDNDNVTETSEHAQDKAVLPNENNATRDIAKKVKRELNYDDTSLTRIQYDDNGTAITGNDSHRLMLDTSRTLFESDSGCEFAEFMPILSTIFACVWITFFTMCAGGGRARTGLQQPWRILTPALLFAMVMVALTGHSFTVTNKGLHAFCAAFYNVTNSTTCASVDPYLERGWNASWGLGTRAASTRAASAGVLAAWAVAAAVLLARCLAAPDFNVKRTGVYLKDPHQKIVPHLKCRSKQPHRSLNSSPTKRDTVSLRSEPTLTTELVSATLERQDGPDSAPSSLEATPERCRPSETMEMTSPHQQTHPETSNF